MLEWEKCSSLCTTNYYSQSRLQCLSLLFIWLTVNFSRYTQLSSNSRIELFKPVYLQLNTLNFYSNAGSSRLLVLTLPTYSNIHPLSLSQILKESLRLVSGVVSPVQSYCSIAALHLSHTDKPATVSQSMAGVVFQH